LSTRRKTKERAATPKKKAKKAKPPIDLVRRRAEKREAKGKTQDQKAVEFGLTDMGNAARFERQFRDIALFCQDYKSWLVWDKSRWRIDNRNKVVNLAKICVRAIREEAAEAADDDKAERLWRHARHSESEKAIKAMLELAKSSLAATPEELDGDHWLMNVKNGTLELNTLRIREHSPKDYATKLARRTVYNAAARCPRWDAFLDRVFAGDRELIAYLQKAVGYSLTGDVREQVIFILYGTGSNGKSTFLKAIEKMLGEYACHLPNDFLISRNRAQHPTAVADLKGVRLAVGIEVERGGHLSEVLVKTLTGGDRLKARRLYHDFFEFDPSHKIFMALNSKPTILGQDDAIWRRIKLIPFEVRIPDEEQDKTLGEWLIANELPGILNWALEGLLRWKKEGLIEPPSVKRVTDEYRADSDPTYAFINTCCFLGDTYKVPANRLYGAYLDWCQSEDEQPISKKALGIILAEQGFRNKHTREGTVWFGIGINEHFVDIERYT
jgi:putative DNA primase/helicase